VLKTALDLRFSLEAFIMGGGWLVFGDGQKLYVSKSDGERAAARPNVGDGVAGTTCGREAAA